MIEFIIMDTGINEFALKWERTATKENTMLRVSVIVYGLAYKVTRYKLKAPVLKRFCELIADR